MMRNYSIFPSLFLQQQNSEFCRSSAPDPSTSLQMNEFATENDQAQLNHHGSAFSSGCPYLTSSAQGNFLVPAMINQCSSNDNAEKERYFGPPFQSEMLRDSRKRPLEDLASRDGIFGMISSTKFPDHSQVSKRKAIEQPLSSQLLKAPVRRSQKLSDKITSLQKVVSPYGKTDTASVLQEACMYIKIAHQEIRRLKVSYFGARSLQTQLMHSNSEKWYQDLQSKGLCLAPLSMASQLAMEDSADVSNINHEVPKIMNAWGY